MRYKQRDSNGKFMKTQPQDTIIFVEFKGRICWEQQK